VTRYLDHLATPFLGHLGEVDAQLGALVVGVHAQVRIADRPLDRAELGRVVRLDDHHAGLGDADGGHLRHGGGCAVVVDEDLGEHRRRRATRTDRGELLLGVLDRAFHSFFGLEEGLLDHLLRRLLAVLVFPVVDMAIMR
jgi:hypothetical protein